MYSKEGIIELSHTYTHLFYKVTIVETGVGSPNLLLLVSVVGICIIYKSLSKDLFRSKSFDKHTN